MVREEGQGVLGNIYACSRALFLWACAAEIFLLKVQTYPSGQIDGSGEGSGMFDKSKHARSQIKASLSILGYLAIIPRGRLFPGSRC
jgi:hypothetical protein